ncbi:hypothetical protein OUY22_03300 [Nonomuraea sp. MCN248]|uniref:Uncharacterized protein n=1 Tax=Nonomuraea corallina TaxID=2989783 RepID=A0ABT4S5F0_9ACTN|nr:hypothetical protein [Nonomuraea corallina]MDA0632428.1 hypothetical protein [Nonomuraea corallina]
MAKTPHHAPRPGKAPPKKKSSNVVTLTVIGVVSVMVVGYCAAASRSEEVTADCVDTSQRADDGTYVVVDESFCDDDDRGGGTYLYSGSRAAYHWYYGGTRVGDRVRGGTTLRPSDASITSRDGRTIQRGGFGSSRGGGS